MMEHIDFSKEERYNTPTLTMKQLFAAQELGNLIQLWADDPASVDEIRLARIQELGGLFNIDLAFALWEAQRKVREEFNQIAEQAAQQMASFLHPSGPSTPFGAQRPQMAGSFFNNDLPRRKPQTPPNFPIGNPHEPRQDSGPRDADRAADELTALRIKADAEGLTPGERSRLLELKEIMEQHASVTDPQLITHSPDYQVDGTLVARVPSDVVNGASDTAHIQMPEDSR